MMRCLVYFIQFVLLFTVGQLYSQEYYSVASSNGITLRQSPDITSRKIGGLSIGEDVVVIEKTDLSLEINDGGKRITGFWYKVKSIQEFTGYVFSGYLIEKKQNPFNGSSCRNNKEWCGNTVVMRNFNFNIYGYSNDDIFYKKDTVELLESIGTDISDKLLYIKPQSDSVKVQVFYAIHELLSYWSEDGSQPQFLFNGYQPYKALKAKNQYFFRIPQVNSDSIRESRAINEGWKEAPNFREVGEGWWVPSYIHQGKQGFYTIDGMYLKVILTYPNGTSETKIIIASFTDGC